jgi:hypothetical protein
MRTVFRWMLPIATTNISAEPLVSQWRETKPNTTCTLSMATPWLQPHTVPSMTSHSSTTAWMITAHSLLPEAPLLELISMHHIPFVPATDNGAPCNKLFLTSWAWICLVSLTLVPMPAALLIALTLQEVRWTRNSAWDGSSLQHSSP